MQNPAINELIRKIIGSDPFLNQLVEIDKHFYHLKQELHIRDALVKELNTSFQPPLRAFAEHPRQGAENTNQIKTGRRDIGIFQTKEHLPIGASKFNIELKFQYYGDLFGKKFQVLSNEVIRSLNRDWNRELVTQKTDLFLLVMCRRPWARNERIAAQHCELDIEDLEKRVPGQTQTSIDLLAKEVSKNQVGISDKETFCIDQPKCIKNDGRVTDYRFLGLSRN